MTLNLLTFPARTPVSPPNWPGNGETTVGIVPTQLLALKTVIRDMHRNRVDLGSYLESPGHSDQMQPR